MKRLLFIAMISVLLLAPLATATSLNFQNPGDNSSVIAYKNGNPSTSSYSWVESTTGGNNYIATAAAASGGGTWKNEGMYVMLPSASATTYAAATFATASYSVSGCGGVLLLHSDGSQLWRYPSGDTAYWKPAAGSRIEVKYTGGTAYIFDDGVQVATKVIANTPSYVGFGSDVCAITGTSAVGIDHYTYGSSENKNTAGLPESDNDKFYLLDDIANPANVGLWNATSDTQADATNMPYQWSRGSASVTPDALTNETINLVYYSTGAIYGTAYTGTAYAGSGNFDISGMSTWPDGYYAVTIAGSGAYSNFIFKRSNGASVEWSSKSYSIGDTGSVITVVADGGYWDSAYDYKLAVLDVYGTFWKNTTILTQTITTTQDWTSDYDQGVYYAWLVATNKDTGAEYILGSDYTTLSAEFKIYGYVNADQTALPITGAVLNWTQGSTTMSNTTSNVTGYYETDSVWLTGAIIGANVTATGYNPYWWNATIIDASSKFVNITMETNPHNYTGIALGGTDRDTLYHRPISSAYIRVFNTTYSEEWSGMQTNNAGFYWIDAATSPPNSTLVPGSAGGAAEGFSDQGTAATLPPHVTATLTNGRLYCVEAYKIGYSNSTTCRVVTGT